VGIFERLGLFKAASQDAVISESEALRKIAAALEHLEPERARFLAGFAYVLGRVAHADLEITDDEVATMERLVREHGGLDDEAARLTVEIARHQSQLFGATQNYIATREFERAATREQKVALLHCAFAVAAAGGAVSIAESNVLRQIADELKLDHRDYADARSVFRSSLGVLRRPEKS